MRDTFACFLLVFFFYRIITNINLGKYKRTVVPGYVDPLTLYWKVDENGRVLELPNEEFEWVYIRCSCDRDKSFRLFYAIVPSQHVSDPGPWLELSRAIGPGHGSRLYPDPAGGLTLDMRGQSYWIGRGGGANYCPNNLYRNPLSRIKLPGLVYLQDGAV